MNSKIKVLGKLSLVSAMACTAILSNIVFVHAADKNDSWQLAKANFDKIEDNDVYLTFESGQKARITFLNNDVLRVDVEPKDAEFKEYPEPMATTHTTKITVKSEADYDAEYGTKITVSGQDSGNTIEIASASAKLIIDKETAKMCLEKANGDVVWQEEESLKYNGTETVQTLKTETNEYFYGGGQQNGNFSHKNQKILIENKSTWVSGGVSSPSPFYMSSKGYGAMRNTFQPGSYDFSSTAEFEHDENRFDAYYFVGDDMKDVLNDYIELTGNPILMPKYGFYQGNADCYNGDGEELTVDGLKRAKEYMDNDMPVGWFLPNDGYGCGYGKSTDADTNISNLKSFVDQAKQYGFVSGLWTENDLDKLDKEVSVGGTQMIKTDVAWVGEGYSFGLNAVRQAFEGIENNSSNRGFVVSLDGWAGTQRYAGLWSGDQTGGNWEYIRFHIPTYIGAGLSGQPNVGSDLDGIYGSGDVISTRDFQWKAFTPIEINMDGWTTGAEKNPWYHEEPFTSINRMYLKMKTGFMPYSYTFAKEAHDTGVPMVRGLVLEYPEDPFTWGTQTQYEYMWGDSLLVAPVYSETDHSAGVRNNIYLPDENQVWIDYFTGDQYQGGQVINNFSAPLWKLPLFVKNGAILPKDVENNSQLFLNGDEDRIFEVYPYGNTEFQMYDDDGMSQEYKEGAHSSTLITSQAPEGTKGTATITVNKTEGSFTGMKNDRATQFIVNVSEKPESLSATVGGKDITLKEVSSEDEFNKAEGNVYFYNAAPNLNHYATEGSEFADTKIITTPKVMVKIAKTDITANAVELKVEGFINVQNQTVNENDKDLSGSTGPVMSAETTDTTISVSWETEKNVSYDLLVDGNEQAVYRNVTSPFTLESLNAAEEHTFALRKYNTKSTGKWGDVQRFMTSENRYKNVVPNMTATTSSEIGGYPVSNAVDSDESTLWYTDWNDPVAYSGPKTITIDLQEAYQVDKFEYLNNGSAQIKNHEIQISLDGVNFKTIEKSVWERPKEGDFRVFVDLKGEAARYVRLISYDKHHNSANEFRVYKVNDTDSFNPASTKGNKNIGDDDITFLENYMGVTADNAKLWAQANPGDFNYNNEIDAYDLAFTLAQNGLEQTGKKAAGTISLSADKKTLKAGEEATITINGNNLKDVYAFGLRIPVNAEDIKVKDIKTLASDATAGMTNMSKLPQSSTDYVVAFSSKGNAEALQGNQVLATMSVIAQKDIELNLEPSNAIVISTGLDVRTAFGGNTELGDVAKLERILAAANIDLSSYTSESSSELTAAIKAAQAVLDHVKATQSEMDTAVKGILQALNGLETRVSTHADVLTLLLDTITHNATLDVYAKADLDKIFAAVATAEEIAKDTEATPEEVDASIASVKERLMSFKDLNDTMDTSNNIYMMFAQRVVDELNGNYTEASINTLKEAIAAVNKTRNTVDTSGVDAAIVGLTSKDIVDTNILQTYVNIAEAMQLDDYDNVRGETARMALNTAKELLKNQAPTQVAINEQVNELSDALIQVLATDLELMRDSLNVLIKEAKAMDVSSKTTASKEAFEAALTAAEKALDEQVDDFEALSAAYQNLTAAINGLQEKTTANKADLKAAIEAAEKIDLSFYTKESQDQFTARLKEAKAVYESETATQEDVDQILEALNAAIKALVKNEINDPTPDPKPTPEPTPTPTPTPGGGSEGNQNDGTKDEIDKNVNTGDTTSTSGLAGMFVLSAGAIYILKKKKEA